MRYNISRWRTYLLTEVLSRETAGLALSRAIGGAENAGVENAGVEIAGVENTRAKMYVKPSEQKITRKAWESLAYIARSAP